MSSALADIVHRAQVRTLAADAAAAARPEAPWRPWRMTPLADARAPAARAVRDEPPPAVEPVAPAPAVDEAELARIRQQAAEAAAAQARVEGLARGYDEGYAAGRTAGQTAVQQQAAQLEALAASLPLALRSAEVELTQAIVALALAVARKVVHQTLQAQPESVVALVQDLLRREPALQGEPRLLLHPADLELVASALGAQLRGAGWELRADEGLTRGGCTVIAGTGTYDARVETRWERAAGAVTGPESQG